MCIKQTEKPNYNKSENHGLFWYIKKTIIFALQGKFYTTSSCRTPPGPEGSKGRRS